MTLIIPQLIERMINEGCTCRAADVLRSVRYGEGQESVYTFFHQDGCPFMNSGRDLLNTYPQLLS